MPVLSAVELLPARPHRVIVAGTSGSGKTTLARQISAVLQVPYTEIDALYHGPRWTVRADFAAVVARFADEPAWVTEWQYPEVRQRLAAAADLLVWLDLSRARVMWQITRRTVRRRRRRQVLWNGNVEPALRTVLTDPDHVVRWAWRTHPRTARQIDDVVCRRPELYVVRLTSHAEADAWLAGPLRACGAG